jgi:hypothetical protein
VSSSLAITESSEVRHLRVELYRKDYRRSIWDTADGSTCVIVYGVNVRASGINSLYSVWREVTCHALHTQHVTIWCQRWDWTYTRDNIYGEILYLVNICSGFS